jgi:hypothetical protein
MSVMARKKSEKTAAGKEGDRTGKKGKKGT